MHSNYQTNQPVLEDGLKEGDRIGRFPKPREIVMNESSRGSGGLGLGGVLLVVFLVLKLTGLIDWSWWWVLSPLWISAIVVAVCVGIIIACNVVTRD